MHKAHRAVRALSSTEATRRDWRLGTVTSDSPLYVQLDGEEAAPAKPLARARGYTPAVDDRVLCVRIGKSWLVVDAVEAP